jgi:hypothetical protein
VVLWLAISQHITGEKSVITEDQAYPPLNSLLDTHSANHSPGSNPVPKSSFFMEINIPFLRV